MLTELVLKPNSTILFTGDSITDCGRNRDDSDSLGYGYVPRVAKVLDELYPKHNFKYLNRGVSGDRAIELHDRLSENCLALKPDFVSIYIGINDTWRNFDSNEFTSPDDFYNTYKIILTKIKAELPDIKIMLIEPFVLSFPADRIEWRSDLDPKIQMVRRLATEYADFYLPLDGIIAKNLLTYKPEEIAEDGVHPTDLGNAIIAKEYLKVIGAI